MKNDKINENIKQLKEISSKMPKTINEAIDFNEDSNEELLLGDDEMTYEPQQKEPQDNGMDVEAFIDSIRKQSLKGMAQLSDNPDDEQYQLLKKIWQICDKKPEQQKMTGDQQQNGNI